MKSKVMTLKDAMMLVNDGDSVATVSAALVCYPEYLSQGLVDRFEETGHPRDLTFYAGCGHSLPGDLVHGDAKFGRKGLIKCYFASHPMTSFPVMDMIANEEIEGYCIPQGTLNQLYRASAAKQPGLFSKIGLGTYIDPRQEGGRLNKKSQNEIVKLVEMDGEEWLYYKSFPINVALIRGTTADEDGNITIEEEALKLEILETALAAKAQKGAVIVQVKRVVKSGTLCSKDVVVPGEIVDAVVLAEEPEKNHMQTNMTFYSPFISGQLKKPAMSADKPKTTLETDDVICRRAMMELYPGCIVNVGLGIGAAIPSHVEAEGFLEKITFTVELGTFGGVPTKLPDFGAAVSPTSFLAHPSMFDYYHTGSLDIAYLGAAEIDKEGNVNVSKMNGRNVGQGGFIDISSTSKKTVFVSYFTAKGLKAKIAEGKLVIDEEGKIPKFVDRVAQITYSGRIAPEDGREAVYVTERAVFKLAREGIMLIEIAPGVDLEKDVLAQMGFKPLVSADLKLMDERIFLPGRMGCFD